MTVGSPMQPGWAVGLMTGTVLDGKIDIALIRSDGVHVADFGPWTLADMPPSLPELIERAVEAARRWDFEGPEPGIFDEAERAITRAQSEAVADFLQQHRIDRAEVRVVGFHGQTVLHRAPTPGRPGRTRQLGCGALMARNLGIDVVHNFRSQDVAAGGQGAPLVPIYHAALLRQARPGMAGCVLNLGGVGNITSSAGGEQAGDLDAGSLVAFDTGPANAPLNRWVRRHGLGEMDRGGALAASGRIDEARLQRLLSAPWFDVRPPKSLDRDDFTASMADGLSPADGAALLSAFTAGCVARALEHLPRRPASIVVCGGGRHNPVLLEQIARRCGVAVLPAEALGWRGDAMEAECFAFLALRRLRGLPISFPGTTGVAAPMTGGTLSRPAP